MLAKSKANQIILLVDYSNAVDINHYFQWTVPLQCQPRSDLAILVFEKMCFMQNYNNPLSILFPIWELSQHGSAPRTSCMRI